MEVVFPDGDSREKYCCGICSQPQDTMAQVRARGCPVQAPAMEPEAVGFLAAVGLGPINHHRRHPSAEAQVIPRSSLESGLGTVLGARPGVDQAGMNYLLNMASLS